VDEMRENGIKVGLVKIRLYRPFPVDDVISSLKKFKNILVVDRALSLGSIGGPLAAEIKSVMYNTDAKPNIFDFVAGLSGRDVPPDQFAEMYHVAMNGIKKGQWDNYYMVGVRE
jgi:pyruvate ferredoxin oxidoreductase alpha subunit